MSDDTMRSSVIEQPMVHHRCTLRVRVTLQALVALVALVALAWPGALRGQADVGLTDAALSGWRASVRSAALWDSYLQCTSEGPQGDVMATAGVDAGRLWRSARTRVALVASAGTVHFAQLAGRDRRTFAIALDATRRLTRRADATLQYRGASELMRRTLTVAGEGTLLGDLDVARTQTAVGMLAFRATPLTTVTAGAQYREAEYRARGAVNGYATSGSATLRRRQSPDATLLAEYTYRRSSSEGITVDVQQLGAGWEARLGDRFALRLMAGAVDLRRLPVAVTDSSGPLLTPIAPGRTLFGAGDAMIQLRSGRNALSADYDRSVGQVFGGEQPTVFATDALSVAYQRALASQLRLRTTARQTWSRETGRVRRRIGSTEGALDMHYEPRAGLLFHLGATVRQRGATNKITGLSDRFDGHQATFGVGYAWSQIRTVPPAPVAP